jgi:exopolysaccharide production protein ExoY
MEIIGYANNQTLLEKAEAIMKSSSKTKGVPYLNSRTKRWLDLSLASTGTILASPLVIFASALVFAQDGKNPFFDNGFVNPVTGKFSSFWKIRTMNPGANLKEADLIEQGAFYLNKRNGTDSRITPLGKILRKTSADELPQLYDVIKGDYSLVGPRKYTDLEWEQLIKPSADPIILDEFTNLLRSGLKFGVTGLGTLLARNPGGSGNTINERLALSILYGNEASLVTDLKIIGLTTTVLFQGK